MRVRRKLNIDIAEKLKGHSSVELNDKCPDRRKVFPDSPCTNSGCEYSIRQSGYMNCSFVASEAGAHTLEAIGGMMNMTREGVRLIERRALKNFKAAWQEMNDDSDGATIQELRPPPRPDRINSDRGKPQREDDPDVVSALDDRELVQRVG